MPALELRGIVKSFGQLRANDSVDLAVEWGQVHALLGENGAGKSTLMNIAYGLIRPDTGEILVDGRRAEIHGPTDAMRAGIGMVHQHFMLVPPLTVAENVVLGREVTRARTLIDLDRACALVAELGRRYGLEVDPRARVEQLSVGEQQRVEIIKVLYRGARLLILDEPTAVLTPQEVERLFQVVRTLKAEGAAVVFITHKLAEVAEVADTITVMRRGRVVAVTSPGEASIPELAEMMVGRPVMLQVEKSPARPGEVVLDLADLVVLDDRRQAAVDRFSLQVRAGEIVGIAGCEGNGQGELVDAIVGLRPLKAGRMHVGGADVSRRTTRQRLLGSRLGVIPPDRQRLGLVLEMPIFDNAVLSTFDREPFARRLLRQLSRVYEYAGGLIRRFDVRTDSPARSAASLSGGNQQKLVVARELARDPRVLIAAQPTRGVDVGSIEFIHRRLVEQRDDGLGVLLISSELDEVLSVSDRVAVIYRGRVAGLFEAATADRGEVGLLMAGGRAATA